jgi:hypothetical protein
VLEEKHGFNKQVSEVLVWVWNNFTKDGKETLIKVVVAYMTIQV